MASLELDPASGRYRMCFRYAGRTSKRSLRTKHRRIATAALGQVEETLRLLQLGMSKLPTDVDPGAFIVSGGRCRHAQRPRSPVETLSDLFRVYQEQLPAGAKEAKTT